MPCRWPVAWTRFRRAWRQAKTDGPTQANIDQQITFIDNYITSGVDGILFAALLKPRPARKDFLARSLQLLMTSMAAPGPG